MSNQLPEKAWAIHAAQVDFWLRLLALIGALSACSGVRNVDAAADCTAKGGTCMFGFCADGGPSGFAGVDCNPEHNPGGAVCCQR